MKFKVGDEVRILPSAVGISVAKDEVGKIGKILQVYSPTQIIIHTATGGYEPWVVRECDIAPVIKIGQQLMFQFMEEG